MKAVGDIPTAFFCNEHKEGPEAVLQRKVELPVFIA